MGLGRKGERVANTPMRILPPSRGGRTVGDQPSRTAPENCQMSQMWLNPSSPRRASGLRNSGSKTTVALSSSTRPLCLGMPNLVGKSLWMRAMTWMVCCSDMRSPPLPNLPQRGGELRRFHYRGRRTALSTAGGIVYLQQGRGTVY